MKKFHATSYKQRKANLADQTIRSSTTRQTHYFKLDLGICSRIRTLHAFRPKPFNGVKKAEKKKGKGKKTVEPKPAREYEEDVVELVGKSIDCDLTNN